MSAQGHVLLIGSVPLQDPEAVMSKCGQKLGHFAKRFPDGETGERINWIRWQRHIYDENPAMELVELRVVPGVQDGLERPYYRVRETIDPKTIRFRPLGIAAYATKSYEIFRRLKAEGSLPRDARFQVCVPTVVALLSGFVILDDRAKVEPALDAAMEREIQDLASRIPNTELSIQWDVCHEVLGHDGGYALHFDDVLKNAVERICQQVKYVPDDIEVGIHLCYGDPGHKHVIEPKDTATCVAFSNAIVAGSRRRIDWIHFPIPRGWQEAKYYDALSRLQLPSRTELYLGLVHQTDGIAGTRARIELARRYVSGFGVATECGLGRRNPASIDCLLDLHKDAALTP